MVGFIWVSGPWKSQCSPLAGITIRNMFIARTIQGRGRPNLQPLKLIEGEEAGWASGRICVENLCQESPADSQNRWSQLLGQLSLPHVPVLWLPFHTQDLGQSGTVATPLEVPFTSQAHFRAIKRLCFKKVKPSLFSQESISSHVLFMASSSHSSTA